MAQRPASKERSWARQNLARARHPSHWPSPGKRRPPRSRSPSNAAREQGFRSGTFDEDAVGELIAEELGGIKLHLGAQLRQLLCQRGIHLLWTRDRQLAGRGRADQRNRIVLLEREFHEIGLIEDIELDSVRPHRPLE